MEEENLLYEAIEECRGLPAEAIFYLVLSRYPELVAADPEWVREAI